MKARGIVLSDFVWVGVLVFGLVLVARGLF
jgi:hypothetical protein